MHKKSVLLLITGLIFSLMLSACQVYGFDVIRGSGNVVTEARNVSDFDQVILNGTGKVIVTQGSTESLEIEAEDNIMDELTSTVRGNTLTLGYTEHFWQISIIPNQTIIYHLSVIDLNEITLNGANDLEIDTLETDSIVIDLNGAGKVDIGALMAQSLEVTISGTGSMTIAGQVDAQTVKIEGTGNYQAGDLQTSSTEIQIDGLGNGTVWATDELNITINGGGSLNYYGTPNVMQDINGLGDINNRGDK